MTFFNIQALYFSLKALRTLNTSQYGVFAQKIKKNLSFSFSVLSIPLLLLLTACANSPAKQSSQYIQQKNYQSPCLQIALQNKKASMLLGYGNGSNVSEAKQQALYDIANQIEVNVSGETNREANKVGKQVNTKYSQKVKTRASALLSSVEIACSDINDPSGQYHFALRYDQRELADIFSDKLLESFWQGKPGKINWQGSSVMKSSSFVSQINKKLIAYQSSHVEIVNIKLFRKDQEWYLELNNIVKPIKSHQLVELLNWDSLNTPNFQVSLQNEFDQSISTHMQEGDEFRFVINSKQSGYLSVFNIYEDGRVTKIRDNIPINKTLILPEHQGSFSAGLLVPNQSTRDQYVFLMTNKKIDTQAFRQLMPEENGNQEQKNYTLNLFLFWLDQQTLAASASLQVETVPR
ncbi:hypothetical protein ACUR5C_08300 [Aliikangiella sp. IMCC44653]